MCFPVWILWDSCCRPMRHITSTHYSHNPAPPTTRSDGFLRTTTSSCCCNARRSTSNSSSTCCCNTRCCCDSRCSNTLYRSKITPVQAVIFWRRLPTLQQQQSSPPVRHRHERRCNFRSEDVPCLGLLHEFAPAVPSAGRTGARTSCGLRRREGEGCRLYTHNGTKALIRRLHKAP